MSLVNFQNCSVIHKNTFYTLGYIIRQTDRPNTIQLWYSNMEFPLLFLEIAGCIQS